MTSNVVLLLALATVTVALPQYDYDHHHAPVHHVEHKHIPILKQSFEQHKEGYQFSYETGNGIHASESGYIKNKGDKHHETLVQKGTVTYHDEHGHPITLTYVADEHGFQAQGAHLPTPPPIPDAIYKATQQHQAAHQQAAHYQGAHHQAQQIQPEQQQLEYNEGQYDGHY